MKKLIFLLLLVSSSLFAHPAFLSSEINREEPTRADSLHGFDVQHYDLDLTIDDQIHYISGTVTADITAETELSEINFELEQMTVNSVFVNSIQVDFEYDQSIINIPLSGILTDDEFEITINYEGYPQLSNDVYHIGMIFNSTLIFTLSDPSGCRWWVPTYDHPWDKAIVDFHITGRDDWLAACNGIRTSIVDNNDGTKTHNWIGENPMATFLMSVVFADMVEINDSFGDIPIQNFFPPYMANNAEEDFSLLPEMMQIYSEKYGDYPFEKYGNTVVPMVTFGAMEHQTMTTLGNSTIDGNHGGKYTITHELAHQWFGNCLTPLTWKDVWLSEGFAVYSEAIYDREIGNFDTFTDYVQTDIQGYYKSWMQSNGPRQIYDPAYNETFYPMVYQKAASVLHMLRAQVGEETFWQIIQTYFQTYHNSNVITSEFIEICENISQQDLSQFFQQWIFGTGIPTVEYTIFVSNEAYTPTFKIFAKTNSTTNTDFDLSIPIQFSENTNSDSILIRATPEIFENNFGFLGDIENLEFDPHNWILTQYNLLHQIEFTNLYESDGTISLFWDNFWEEVEIDGFNIYRSEDGVNFEKINTDLITGNNFQDDSVTNGIEYSYYIKAVIDTYFESDSSEVISATPTDFALNQGILVIDETNNAAGTQGLPDDEMVDNFYSDIINAPFSAYDYDVEGEISLDFISNYSTVIWHDDDLNPKHIVNNLPVLGSYVIGGGNLIISGWRTAEKCSSLINDVFIDTDVNIVTQTEFIGADSDTYNLLQIDPDKVLPYFNGILPQICTFDSEAGFYNYVGIENSDFDGDVCAIQTNFGGNIAILGFPLYFCYNNQAELFINSILSDYGETSNSNETMTLQEAKIFPNPYHANSQKGQITLSFMLEKEEKCQINIFNIKGQIVRSFSETAYEKGINNISWNIQDTNNKKVASGIYFFEVKSDKNIILKKAIILK